MVEAGIKPRDIMTFEAFENAVKTVMVLGGSTNATIHLIAMARAAGGHCHDTSEQSVQGWT